MTKLILYSKAGHLLLDEPFNASPIAAEEIRMHITESARTRGIILIDHNFRVVHKIVNRTLLLDQCYLKKTKEKKKLIPYGLLAAFTSLASAQQNDVTSILEVLDVTNGRRTVVKEFPYRVEAPNWTPDGQWLVYNSGGKLYKLSPDSPGEPEMINTGFATRCNNDHVIAADGKQIAISHGTKEDGKSRIYTLPMQGGTPRLITPIAPSYLHGWSPDGRQLAYCADRKGNYDIYIIQLKEEKKDS